MSIKGFIQASKQDIYENIRNPFLCHDVRKRMHEELVNKVGELDDVIDIQSSLSSVAKITVDDDLLKALTCDLHRLYTEKVLTDITLKAKDGHAFPAHRSILSVRSPVFKTMLENDMTEKQNSVVNISDLNADTVERMLLCMYTGTVGELQWESAMELYYAGDKYEILSLKNKCSAFIKTHLSTSNACDALVLADMHNDEDLKIVTRDFICSQYTKIFRSNAWKSFITRKPELSAEIMQFFIEKIL